MRVWTSERTQGAQPLQHSHPTTSPSPRHLRLCPTPPYPANPIATASRSTFVRPRPSTLTDSLIIVGSTGSPRLENAPARPTPPLPTPPAAAPTSRLAAVPPPCSVSPLRLVGRADSDCLAAPTDSDFFAGRITLERSVPCEGASGASGASDASAGVDAPRAVLTLVHSGTPVAPSRQAWVGQAAERAGARSARKHSWGRERTLEVVDRARRLGVQWTFVAGARREAGMSTAEYAVGTIAACGFAALLFKVVTSGEVQEMLASLVQKALSLAG
ncbi:DUF4244 domain-containing protein [Acrocarpospora corrugata]|nr:DUF4244 domain-containing protein [Acrocarpospora corrugata]